MGYPKWGFGVWGNGVPDIRTWVQRWSFGCRGLRNGGYESTLRAQNRIKGEREQSIFAIIRACKTASYSGIKHGINTLKTSDLSLYRTLIPNTLHYTLSHPNNDFPTTADTLCNGLKICICICNCKKWADWYSCVSPSGSTAHIKNLYTPPGAWHGKNYGMA